MLKRDHIIEKARRLAREGNYQAAILEVERLVEQDPGDLGARLRIGYLHACNRDRESAAETYLEVAHAYERAGDPETASKVLTQVLRLRPEQADVYFWLADLLGALGQPAEARRWLEAVERLLLEKKRPKEALRALEAMVELDPGNVALCIRLGEGLVHRGRREEALAVLRQAADVLRMAEWVDDFIKVAERIAYLDPAETALCKELAALYLRKRDPRAALRMLQRCYRAHKDDPETLSLLVETFLSLEETGKAVTILELLAELHQERGEAEQQEAVWKRILSLQPSWVPRRSGKAVPSDVRMPESPRELLAEDRDREDSPVPLTTDERQLATLERSLQPDPAGGSAKRRFLPALTAQTETRGAQGGTTELDLGDLEEVAGGEGRPAAPVLTQELDLADLEVQEIPGDTGPVGSVGSVGSSDEEVELQALEAMLDEETLKRRPFRPVSTVPDASVDRRSRDTQVSSPRKRPRR